MNIQSTKLLLDKLKIKENDLKKTNLILNPFINNWHCNILKFGRINTILITNDKTLYSFFIGGYKANDFKDFKLSISEDIFTIMRNLNFQQKHIEVILNSLQDITISKTSNKGVLASMTQVKRFVEGGLENGDDVMDINHRINTIPHKVLEFKTSYEEFIELLDYNL